MLFGADLGLASRVGFRQLFDLSRECHYVHDALSALLECSLYKVSPRGLWLTGPLQFEHELIWEPNIRSCSRV